MSDRVGTVGAGVATTGRTRRERPIALDVLLVLTVLCWVPLAALVALAAADGHQPPAAWRLPALTAVDVREGDDSGYCGSGGCFATVFVATATDGAPAAVTVERIVAELRGQGWQVLDGAPPEEVDLADEELAFTVGTGRSGSVDDGFEPGTSVEIALSWAGEEHPSGFAAISFRPGTPIGNWLAVAVLLAGATVAGFVGWRAAVRRAAPPERLHDRSVVADRTAR